MCLIAFLVDGFPAGFGPKSSGTLGGDGFLFGGLGLGLNGPFGTGVGLGAGLAGLLGATGFLAQ